MDDAIKRAMFAYEKENNKMVYNYKPVKLIRKDASGRKYWKFGRKNGRKEQG